jgi:hypothetical protein
VMKASPYLILALVLTVCFTLATGIEPRATTWSNRAKSDNVLGMLFGDGRKLFANQFFTMADVYFHSGYYPSIFDRKGKDIHIEEASHDRAESDAEEEKEDFLGKPKDWIDAFGRHFRITEHKHLQHGNEREILPWLKLAAEMDPQMIETYTVGSYWLRLHLNEPQQAEAFLREGLRNNPGSYEILFELGRLYDENLHETDRARNVWELALKQWMQLPSDKQKEEKLAFEEITVHLARLEEKAGNWAPAINWLQAAKKVSPSPDTLQKQIDELQAKLAAQPK